MNECPHIQDGRLMGVSDRFLWVPFGSSVGLAFPLFLCFSLAKTTQNVGLHFWHLGK